MAKKPDSKKQQKYIQQPLNGMAIVGCVCSGEMFIGNEAADLITKIPLNPMATPEMIEELKHEKEPLDCVFIIEYQFSKSGTEYLDTKPISETSVSEIGYLEMQCSKSCYLCDLELVDLFENEVIEQI